jgi:hypothetical protein
MMIKYAEQTNNCKTVTNYSASQGKHLEVETKGIGNLCQLHMNTFIYMIQRRGGMLISATSLSSTGGRNVHPS